MSTLLIRRLDDDLKQALRERAAQNKRSMEEEARVILRSSLQPGRDEGPHFVDAIRKRFKRFGGVELELPPRTPVREPPSFE
jgi:plasmid stability protein